MAFGRKKKNKAELDNSPEKETDKQAKPKGKAGRIIKLFLILILITIFTITIIQNLSPAPISFLGWKGQLPTIAIILIFTLIGYILGALTYNMIFGGGRKKRKQKKKKDKPEE